MEIALIIIFGVFILLAFILGLKYGQKIANKEEITFPSVNIPISEKSKQEEEKPNKDIETLLQVMENVEAYDGTSKNQKKIEGGV